MIPNQPQQQGRISPALLVAALLAASVGYGAARYGPLLAKHDAIKEAIRRAGALAVAGDEAGARAGFDRRMRELGVDWLAARDLYWQPGSGGRLDLGARYSVIIDHALFEHEVLLSWYCTASAAGCAAFRPTFVE